MPRGGNRAGSGQKKKYGEKTKSINFKIPESKVEEVKKVVKTFLEPLIIKRHENI
jgi:hypothetical protein